MANRKARQASEKIRQDVVKTILDLMEKDGLNWIQGFDPQMFLARNDLTPTVYRGVNRMHLAAWMLRTHAQDPRFCTFNQARENGWKVKKGSKALHVEHWKMAPYVLDMSLKRHFLKECELEKLRNRGIEPGWHLCLAACVPVFNYGDIEGPEAYLPQTEDSDIDGVIAKLVGSSRCPVYSAAGDAACYRPRADEIIMPPRAAYDDACVYAATLIHEMAHSTKVALGRKQSENEEEYALEELRAEFASVFLCAELGIPLDGLAMESHAAYLKAWLSKCREDGKVLLDAITDAQRIADFLLARYREAESSLAQPPTPGFWGV